MRGFQVSKHRVDPEVIEALLEQARRPRPNRDIVMPSTSGSTEMRERGFLSEEDMFEFDRARGRERVFHGKSNGRPQNP